MKFMSNPNLFIILVRQFALALTKPQIMSETFMTTISNCSFSISKFGSPCFTQNIVFTLLSIGPTLHIHEIITMIQFL